MREHGTLLLGFDEAQNMARSTRTLEDAKNLLRKLSQDLRATQIYSGIELRANGLLADTSGRQLGERIRIIQLHPYSAAGPNVRELWRETLDSFEDGLCLIGHEPGTLRELAQFLYNRTGGVMGELSNLLRAAAVELIRGHALERTGREQLTETLLRWIDQGDASVQRQIALGDTDEPDGPWKMDEAAPVQPARSLSRAAYPRSCAASGRCPGRSVRTLSKRTTVTSPG